MSKSEDEMKTAARIIVAVVLICLMPFIAMSQQKELSVFEKIKWQKGPSSGSLDDIADVHIPDGYVFADGDDTRLLMEEMKNPISDTELGFIAPSTLEWFLVFEFNEVGYIKDDEKNSLDAGAMLKGIQKGNEAANRERTKRGWPILNITGWEQPPRYNPSTHYLEWAIRGESESSPIINWNTRLLGRGGVMKVTLVTAPEILNQTMPYYHSIISGFNYTEGNRYTEFRQGDKMAKYGLSALVVGGAAAVAAKTGILKHLWKGLIVAGIAVIAFFKKLFTRKT